MNDKNFQNEEKSLSGTKTKETELSVFMRKNMNIGSITQHLKVLVNMEGRSSKREEIAVFVLGSLKKYLETDHSRLMPIFSAEDGVSDLLKYLGNLDYKAQEYLSHTIGLDCIRRIFSSPHGRKSLISRKELCVIMAKSLLCDNIQAKVFVLELFGTMVQLTESKENVIEAIIDLHIDADETPYQILLSQLNRTYGYHKIYWELRLAILSFINCLIKSYGGSEKKLKRIEIRKVLEDNGFIDIISKLKKIDHQKIVRHVDHYLTGKDVDEGRNTQSEYVNMYDCISKPNIKEFSISKESKTNISINNQPLSMRLKEDLNIDDVMRNRQAPESSYGHGTDNSFNKESRASLPPSGHLLPVGHLPSPENLSSPSTTSSDPSQLSFASLPPSCGIPPPPPGGIPPPPPPLGSSPAFVSWFPQAPIQLKSFNWSKIHQNNILNSVWKEIDCLTTFKKLDCEEIHENFKSLVTKGSVVSEKAQKLTLIDQKRAQSCEVILNKTKLNSDLLYDLLLKMDPEEILNVSILQQLLKLLPSNDEKALLQDNIDKIDEFSETDIFFYATSRIPRYEYRLKCLLNKRTFNEKYMEVSHEAEVAIKCSSQLLNSRKLKQVLELILAIGNYLNSGPRGNAYGFKISSLSKLLDTKTTDNKSNLLNYIVKTMDNKFSDFNQFFNELDSVIPCSKMCISDLLKNEKVMKEMIKIVEDEIKFYEEQSGKVDKNDSFIISMRTFVANSRPALQELNEQFSLLKLNLPLSCKYFGEDIQEIDNMISDMAKFIQNVEAARKKMDTDRLKEKKDKQLAELKKAMDSKKSLNAQKNK